MPPRRYDVRKTSAGKAVDWPKIDKAKMYELMRKAKAGDRDAARILEEEYSLRIIKP